MKIMKLEKLVYPNGFNTSFFYENIFMPLQTKQNFVIIYLEAFLMGRELRRKQAKKDGKSLERIELKEDNQIKKYLINIVSIVGIFAIIYLISALFITK